MSYLKEKVLIVDDKGPEAVSRLQKSSVAAEPAMIVADPKLRKKVCQKLATYLEEIWGLNKDTARGKNNGNRK